MYVQYIYIKHLLVQLCVMDNFVTISKIIIAVLVQIERALHTKKNYYKYEFSAYKLSSLLKSLKVTVVVNGPVLIKIKSMTRHLLETATLINNPIKYPIYTIFLGNVCFMRRMSNKDSKTFKWAYSACIYVYKLENSVSGQCSAIFYSLLSALLKT